jgi:Bacterial dipeptidyl-peptidase Sh3 domain/NlpC/P60 family
LKASKAISSSAAPRGAPPRETASSCRTDERFQLSGPSLTLDARIHAYRSDIADIGLAGQMFAPHYARPLVRGCGARPTMVRSTPTTDGTAVSELLPGEEFSVLEYAGGFAWGYCRADHVTGYVEAIALAEPIEPTHIVCEKAAPVAAGGTITAPITGSLPMGARLHGHEAGACLATEYGCVALSHLRPFGDHEPDPVIVAERLLGSPFLAGGRTAHGIDAAALIQLALGLCGMPAPRFLDQLAALGEPADGRSERGDLVLFDGGAGLMVDDLLMIHASEKTGKVAVEPAGLHAGTRRRLPL